MGSPVLVWVCSGCFLHAPPVLHTKYTTECEPGGVEPEDSVPVGAGWAGSHGICLHDGRGGSTWQPGLNSLASLGQKSRPVSRLIWELTCKVQARAA